METKRCRYRSRGSSHPLSGSRSSQQTSACDSKSPDQTLSSSRNAADALHPGSNSSTAVESASCWIIQITAKSVRMIGLQVTGARTLPSPTTQQAQATARWSTARRSRWWGFPQGGSWADATLMHVTNRHFLYGSLRNP